MIAPLVDRRRPWLAAVAVFAGVLAALLLTSPATPLVWDEGDAILRAEQVPAAWPYTTQREGHPALYGAIIAAGHWLGAGWLPPKEAWRLGPMLLFALAVAALCYRLARDWSLAAGLGGAAALVLMPRVFAHAHFASFDGPLTSCWLLAWASFAPVARRAFARAGPRGNGGVALTAGPEQLPSPDGRGAGGEGGSSQASKLLLDDRFDRRFALPAIIWGAALGATMSCKATGFFAAVAFLAWAVGWWVLSATGSASLSGPGSRSGSTGKASGAPVVGLGKARAVPAIAMLLGLAVALAAFVLFNPPLWRDPFGGSCRFLALNLHRGADPGLNISTQFFGQLYNLDHPLPWYNTLVWTAITVPVGLLLLAIVGAVHVVRQWRDPAGTLLLMHWLVLLVVRALPGTPPHDAERLILPSFAFLAALAGVGGYVLLSWRRSPGIGESISVACRTATPGRPAGQECPACIAKPTFIPSPVLGERVRPLQLAAVLSLYLGSATSLVWYAPQWLSYYNLLIGGLPGAAALGMEPTYYWDGLDREALDWLHAHTADDEKIAFASAPDDNLLLLQQWGLLRRATNAAAPGKFRWYVVQRRPGGMQPGDRELVERARPAFRKTIRPGGRGPWRLDTPIVEVYAFPQGQRGAPEQSDGR